mmetsp:Transcript_17361/g.43606  ORF Transcript_17361/g.43606 Transcript_17361/m.43606 type:complete len:302 (-) Transcript_17361:1282-2187(-)
MDSPAGSIANLEHHLSRELTKSTSLAKPNKRASTGGDYSTPLAWLQGVWRGRGKGIYPTIKDFEWNEEMIISGDISNPRPVLHYKQRTWSMAPLPKPMHEEAGFIRVLAAHASGPRVEFVVSAPNGVQTIEEGTLDEEARTLSLRSVCIGRSSTARPPHVVEFVRTYHVDTSTEPPTLHYTMDMSTTTWPTVTRHLEAWLTKVAPGQQPTILSGQQQQPCNNAVPTSSQPPPPLPIRPSGLSTSSSGACPHAVVPTANGSASNGHYQPNGVGSSLGSSILAHGSTNGSNTASPVRQCPMMH